MTSDGVGGPDREASDTTLVEAHLAGDPEAFGVLFHRHRDRLWAVALRTTGNPEDAADALQEALISAFRRADSFRGDSAVTTWLHRIVVNACLDGLRRRKVRRTDPLPDDLDEPAARGAVLAGPSAGPDPGPEAHVVAGERRAQVLAALEELAPEQRAALVLVDMEGYPVAEAAEMLEVPVGTVKSRCARGRARLAVLLADLGPPAPPPDGAGGTRAAAGASHPGGRPHHARGDPQPRAPVQPPVQPSERATEGGEQA